jgi:hypothetical protein
MTRPTYSVCDQKCSAIDGGKGEPDERSGEQGLPACPAEHEADAGRELGVFPELGALFRTRYLRQSCA